MTKKKSKGAQGASGKQQESFQNSWDEKTEQAQTNATPSRADVMNDVRAQREARYGQDLVKGKAQQNTSGADAPEGYVRKSSLYFSVVLALAVGLLAGSLLPGITAPPVHVVGASAPSGSPAGNASANEQKTAELATHILELEEAVRKNPNDVEAWIQLGNLYFDTGKAMQSINAYERSLTLKPDNANVLTDLGIMYREAQQYELAVQSFRKAVQINPKHQNAMFNSGVVLFFDLKRKEEARKVWQELLVLNPQAKAPDGKLLKDMLRELK